jgi:hypothetical protein
LIDVQDILSSDVKIVDATTRTVDPGRGVQTLRFPGEYMPDGMACVGTAPERLEPAILRGWCNQVRSEWSARQDRKEAEAARVKESAALDRDQTDRPTYQPTAASSSGTGDGEAGEAGLESGLEAEVAKWAKRERTVSEEITFLTDRLAYVTGLRDQYARNRLKAQRVLDFYLKSEQDEGEEL